MRMPSCPICATRNPIGTLHCRSCGADMTDPDVLAMAGADAPVASDGAAGALSSERFLGLSLDRLAGGAGLGRLAAIGAGLALVGFIIPVRPGFEGWAMPWAAWGDGPALALLLPLVAAIGGVAVALAGRLSPTVRAAALVALGLAGVLWGLAPLGAYAATGQRALVVVTLGLLVAGASLVVRVCRPLDGDSRYGIAAGAALVIAGMAVPLSETHLALPFEYLAHLPLDAMTDRSPLAVYGDTVMHGLLVRFLSMLALAPAVLLPVAAVMGWARPGGVWDSAGVTLRPIAWLVVLFVPVTFAFLLFNITGWNAAWVSWDGRIVEFDRFSSAVMAGRAKLVFVSAAYVLWVQLGAAALHQRLRGGADAGPATAVGEHATP